MNGRVCVVTGAGQGSLGEATARLLLQLGATVVVTTRDKATAEAQARELGPACIGRDLDLTNPESVASFAEWIKTEFPEGIQVLVNNAGVHLDLLARQKEAALSQAGMEIHWHVNFVGTMQLTRALLGSLEVGARKSQGEARIANVISELHKLGDATYLAKSLELDGTKPSAREGFNSWRAYGQSKLAVLLYSKALARELLDEGRPISVNCLHPGAVFTTVADKGLEGHSALLRVRGALRCVEAWALKTPEEGAQTSLFLAVSRDVNGITGRYFKDCRERQGAKGSDNVDVAREFLEAADAKYLPQ